MTQKNQHIIGQSSDLHQLVLLDEDGFVWYSCDALFSTEKYQNTSILSDFPMIESIFPSLLAVEVKSPPLFFSKVETFRADLSGVYDYRFSRLTMDGQSYILWVIYDYTEIYEKFRTYQQKRNELEIHRQYFEQRLDTINSIQNLKELKEKVEKSGL